MNTHPEVEVVGVHPVDEAPEPCHLIEMIIIAEGFNVSDITQAQEGEPRSNWQVPWDEKVLDDAGERVVANSWDLPQPGEIPDGKTRLVFFFHYLDPSTPLATPWGEIALPDPTSRPDRLAIIEYEAP